MSTRLEVPPVTRTLPARSLDLLVALGFYALTRLWGAVVIHRAAADQQASIWTGPRSGYFDLAQLWDAQWYRIVAVQGYPPTLPVDASGAVQQNAWAFFPAFPYTVKAVMTVTGLPFSEAAVLTNLVLGACAVVVLLTLLQRVAGRGGGLGAVVLLCAAPSAPVLQIAYSETLFLLLFALATLWLVERRYAAVAGVVLLLALTRPVVAPFAVVILGHLIARWWSRDTDPLPRSDTRRIVALGLFTAASVLLWPAIVQVLTGEPDAYARIQGAWRTGGVLQAPFEQTLGITRLLWGDRGPWGLAIGAAVYVAVVLSPVGRSLGAELRTWCLAYPTYVLAVHEPWTSTYRYALFLFPLFVLPGTVRRVGPLLVVVLAVVGMAYQVRWVDELLVFVPPTDFPP
ncbi:MAG TPA: hypothetical protein VF661_07950 [Actinomycetales bacterium]